MRNIAYIYVAILSLSFNSAATAREVWTIASLEWPPFSGKNLPEGGSGVKALREALNVEGIGLEVEYYPWSRAMHTAKKPGYAGFFPAWLEDVHEGFKPSGSLFKSPLIIAQRRDSPLVIKGLDSLKGKSIAVVQDYGNTKEFNDMVASGAIAGNVGVDDLIGLKKLEVKRVQGMIIDINVLKYILKFEFASAAGLIEANTGWSANKDLLVAVNGANPNSSHIVNILKKISKAGKTQKIVDEANAAIFK